MSEEINLNDSNLCITEDVFEEFQANTLYEEDEYITFSDIAPPEETIPNVAADITEIPYDNEIILSASQDEVSNRAANSNTTSTPEETSHEIPDSSNVQDLNIEKSSLKTPDKTDEQTGGRPRRSRKTRTNYYSMLNDDMQESSVEEKQKRPRGRGRKTSNIQNSADVNGTQIENDKPSDLIENIPKNPGRRRGRGKNVNKSQSLKLADTANISVCHTEISSTQDINNESSNKDTTRNKRRKSTTKDLLNENETKVVNRRGRKKKFEEVTSEETKNNEVTEEEAPPKDETAPPKDETSPNDPVLQDISASDSFVGSFANFVKEFSYKKDTTISSTVKGKQKRQCKSKKKQKSIHNKQSPKKENDNKTITEPNTSDGDDGDDISLSNLKKSFDDNFVTDPTIEIKKESENTDDVIDVVGVDTAQESNENEICEDGKLADEETKTKTEVNEDNQSKDTCDSSLLEEDTSKRPARRKAKKTFHYVEDSEEEDPFANVELSDDDAPRGRKRKYRSDDEYVPHIEYESRKRKKHDVSSDELSGSDIDDLEGIAKYGRKKKLHLGGTPRKRSINTSEPKKEISTDVTTIEPNGDGPEDDIEVCLQSSVIKVNEFENFLAQRMQGTNLKIKKLSPTEPTLSLEIPVIDPNEAKKFEDTSAQTDIIKKLDKSAQTESLHDVQMKINRLLSTEQSAKACEFLKGVVQTTSELGQLMTQKSEDFIKKKINTTNVTDTFKMDYCVKKSFLLFKLAKHNLMQMEEDLAKQYSEFLKNNGLENCREEDKKIVPNKVTKDDDSDCEIVETPIEVKPGKSKFNPKTVFLNKELSIKIAKKPAVTLNKSAKSNINIKGVVEKNAVWISESVMVKKVKPTQSFLAQDSRNKKPPDSFVTEQMVSEFFKQYYYEKAQIICAPFIQPQWLRPNTGLECYYFFLKPSASPSHSNGHLQSDALASNLESTKPLNNPGELPKSPETLFALCTTALQKHLFFTNNHINKSYEGGCILKRQEPASLFRLCIKKLTSEAHNLKNDDFLLESNAVLLESNEENNAATSIDDPNLGVHIDSPSYVSQVLPISKEDGEKSAESLTSLCYKKIVDLICIQENKAECDSSSLNSNWEENYDEFLNNYEFDNTKTNLYENIYTSENEEKEVSQINIVESLKDLCYKSIVNMLYTTSRRQLQDDNSTATDLNNVVSVNNEDLLTQYNLQTISAKMLKTLCYQRIKDLILAPKTTEDTDSIENLMTQYDLQTISAKMLKTLCYQRIRDLILAPKITEDIDSLESHVFKKDTSDVLSHSTLKKVKSLNAIALETIQYLLNDKGNTNKKKIGKVNRKVKPLADICFEIISQMTSNDIADNDETVGKLTINSVNTLSEEAFHNIGESNVDLAGEENGFTDEEQTNVYDEDEYDAEFNNYEAENNSEENNWVSQVEMKLLSSFNSLKPCNKENEPQEQNCSSFTQPEISSVKLEPIEDPPENLNENVETPPYEVESSMVKNEPILAEDQMTVIHDSIVTKREHVEEVGDPLTRPSFDVNQFESFVNSNKMIHAAEFLGDEIFSQSALRVRRQYDPDSDHEEPDTNSEMSLLVPQTFEPLHVETAKGCLMESSSDESSGKKSTGKKKTEKRGKGRPRRNEQATKEKVQPPPPKISEVARLTRKMKERIRQEEKKVESSDSETEMTLPLNVRKDKERKDKEGNDKTKENSNKIPEDEIQCNNVDSTEQIENTNEVDNSFTGFTAVDQNEITSYQKYVKYVYDQILPKVSDAQPGTSHEVNDLGSSQANERSSSPLINPDEPVEMIECVPTMPMFGKVQEKPEGKRVKSGPKSKTNKMKEDTSIQKSEEQKDESEPSFIVRNGWHCYPINSSDGKLNQLPAINLQKLPESFVETYFRYQNITVIRSEDLEVNKLTNLQTLKKSSLVKDGKRQQKAKQKQLSDEQGSKQSSDLSRPVSPLPDPSAENADELTPSEDENNVEDELPPLIPLRQNTTENHLAKNSLMNDESDDDAPISKIKQDKNEDGHEAPEEKASQLKKKPKISPIKTENLMLTADKMMNKELNLLHAPVVLNNSAEASTSGTASKSKHKKLSKRDRTRGAVAEEDSSSEEEKQWVSTKEKLLKRMGKKQDTTMVDDAKRAKLVSEFIERRGDGVGRKRHGGRGRKRATRKMIEREKQLRVLSKELYGDGVDVDSAGRRNVSHSLFKGRRNIRKVIDKKSLARSTVIANMEEFERKRRLFQKLQRLRQVLGCEDDVNVLVINGEVCLEYDFEHHRPLVSIHPFFTKVMKSHQYEGVKFMWDACFESLEMIESGHPGGGCILAHCMGLGKTLQVLALLHTVLTHPRVGMQRILVCCPLSTVLNWVDEIHKWIGPVTDQIKVFELSKLRKTYERAYQLEDWYNGGGIFIIGYELFRSLTTLDPLLDDIRPTIVNKIRTALLDPGPDIIVCDEGHLLKNDCSVLAVAMSRVQTKRRIVLTGTPMQNNLREYYCMVNFIKPNLLGTYSEYSNRFENPIMNGQHRDSRDEDIKLMKQRTHILHKVLEGCLQRQEASVLYPYLPKKHEYTLFISLTKCQWDLYKHYMENYAQQSKQSILKDFHTLQKIWSHPQVLHNFQNRSRDEAEMRNKIKSEKLEDDLATEDLTATEDIKPTDTEVWWLQHLEGGKALDTLESSNKFLIVFSILNECIKLGDKVLIFSTSLITMDSLEFFLKKINKWSLGQEYYRLDGSVPPEVRQKWCREFNAEHNVKTKLFLISTRAGSLGLNMVAANRVIILDTSWNPAHDIQSIFRVYRFGQKKDCYIYRLVAMGTMEQKIYERAVTKQAVACRVVDEQQIDRHYNSAELTELYKYDEHGSGVASGVAVGVCDVALLRVARAACLHAVHEHDSLLRGSTEQQLTELERRDAWQQFQEEHATKQRQNQLTSSLALHISTDFEDSKRNVQIPPLGIATPQFNSFALPNETNAVAPQGTIATAAGKSDTKTKKGKKKKTSVKHCNIPVQQEEQPSPAEPSKEQLPVEENVVKKIMNLLVKYNIHNHQEPKEIAALIANVRKIVSCGQVPQDGFTDELTQSIASVILGKDKEPAPTSMPPLTNVSPDQASRLTPTSYPGSTGRKTRNSLNSALDFPTQSHNAATSVFPDLANTSETTENKSKNKSPGRPRKRRRNRKLSSSENSTDKPQVAESTKPQEDCISELQTKQEELDNRPKRRAALAAVKHIDSLVDSNIIDLDDDDWQADDVGELPQPANHTEPPKGVSKKKTSDVQINQTKKQLESDVNSILLSDDDEPQQPEKTVNNTARSDKQKGDVVNVKSEPQSDNEVVPLHPSLLSNKNFIKIVAHTYLEGNPMLDEDAALLAAQYSTQKAFKEYEVTGKNIESGPIYDIAKKVLGIDILKKLNKSNPGIKNTEEPAAEKAVEPKPKTPESSKATALVTTKPRPGPKSKLKPKGLSELMPKPAAPPPAPPDIMTLVPGARTTTTKFAVTQNTVVPVGLIQRSVNITPDEPEESILPDDDVRIVTDDPGPSTSVPLPTQKTLILNAALAPGQTLIPGHNNILKRIKLSSDGKLVLQNPNSNKLQSVANSTPSIAASADTICLDSDEDDASLAPTPALPTKRVALKSTAKNQTKPQPIPVTVTATNNPMLANMGQIPSQYKPLAQPSMQQVAPNLNQNLNPTESHNYIILPSSSTMPPNSANKFIKLVPRSAAPAVIQNLANQHVNANMYANQMSNLQNPNTTAPISAAQVYANQNAQNMSYANQNLTPVYVRSVPNVMQQNHDMMGNMPQNLNQNMRLINPGSHMSAMAMPGQMSPYGTAYGGGGVTGPGSLPPAPVPTPPAPQPPPSQPAVTAPPKPPLAKNKTVCKPGDILRITKTGEVEILNREEDAEPKDDVHDTPQKKYLPEVKQTKRRRIRKISTSSSSGSDGPTEDPLSILKDVVQIKAADDDLFDTANQGKLSDTPTKKSIFNSNSLIGSTSIMKSSTKPTTTTALSNSKGPETTVKIVDKRQMSSRSTVDLTSNEPSTSRYGKMTRESTLSKTVGTPKSLEAIKKEFLKNPSKITGKSKDIIISSSGKALSTAASDTSAKKAIRVTNVEKIAPSKTYTNTNKRPNTFADSSAKKAKTTPMTLKDFDIDDIDDIIELD